MTETTEPPNDAAIHPADVLLALLVTLLTPMFIGVSGGDIRFARMAALETINGYQASSQADLIAIAQIIAFGLAALGSLSLSMADDLTLSMTLRLRGNANALNRAAEQNRRALRENRLDPAPGNPIETQGEPTEAEVIASVAAARERAAEAQIRLHVPQPAPPTPDQQQLQAAWAAAMSDVAGEFTASLVHLPPAERKAVSHRAALLSRCANDLLSGNVPPPLQPGALNHIVRPGTA